MSAMEKGSIDIRRMKRSDIDAILDLDRKIGEGSSLITYRDLVSTDPGGPLDLSFVAEAAGRIVGCVLARLAYAGVPFYEVCIVHAIVVDPDYQRHGIGSRLVNELVNHCRDEEIHKIRALVDQSNAELRHFIENLGFHRSNIINYDITLG